MEPRLNNFLKNLGGIAFGLLVGLVTLEIGLRLVPEETLNLLITRRLVRQQLYQVDPQIGWRLRPNASGRYFLTGEYDVLVQTNPYGLNDFEHSYQKSPDTYRILILGDSFAEGANVPMTAGFPYVLEECLNEHYQQSIEVINGGVSYYATSEELFFLQHEGLRYEPDLVLVAFFVGNDIEAYAARETEDGWLDSLGGYLIELDETGQLKKTWADWKNPSPYDNVPDFELLLRRYSKIYFVLKHPDSKLKAWIENQNDKFQNTALGQWFKPEFSEAKKDSAPSFRDDLKLMIYAPDFPDGPNIPPKLIEAWAILDKIFSQIQETSKSINAELGVVIIPTRAQAHSYYEYELYKEYSSKYGMELAHIEWDYTAPNQALVQMLDKKDIPSLDLLPHFRTYDPNNDKPFLYFEIDKHLNQNGHRFTAEIMCQWIKENDFIK